ncbi:glycoside hydrolase domain-containing protein [Rhizocola hellebori]|uniref:glycoside hydrolase domain-containing protein n=1 Tax=Rhizocola hellebori TaxID=1392758 RepID=UPI001EF1F436|nr:glycoside hydrolase domain-containing protein [Rhizocola hellebori]
MVGSAASVVGAVAGLPIASQAFAAGPRLGLDYSWSRPSPSAIVAAGYTFVSRYLSRDNTGKNLTKAEADSLIAAGIDVVCNWEFDLDAPLRGYAEGATNAQEAQQQALACGMPPGRPIYFSVDFDATASQQPVIDAYFDGVASVIGRSRTGAYGGYYLIKRLFDNGKINWGWQTYAWSSGLWDSRAQVRQVLNGIFVGGQECDKNEAWAADFGQWGRRGVVTSGDVAVVTSPHRLISAFRRGSDAGVWGVSQASAGGPYGAWSRMGGLQFASYPVSLVATNGLIVVVARGTDSKIWGISQLSVGGSYGSWSQIGSGQPAFSGFGDPTIALAPNGQIVIYARAADGGIWGVSQSQAGGAYGSWSRLGSVTMASSPASLLAANNLLVVIARGYDDKIWGVSQLSVGGGYGSWSQIGSGQPTFAPSAEPTVTLSPSGQIVIYSRAADGGIWGVSQAHVGGAFGSWSRLGSATMASSPASLLAPSNVLVAVARGFDNKIWGVSQLQENGGYGNWAQIGSGQPTFSGDPSAGLAPTGEIIIFAQGTDGYIWAVQQLSPGGAYGSWIRIGS